MPSVITSESYNNQDFLQANAGDWVDAFVDFSMRFSKGSGQSNTVTYNSFGNNYTLTFQQGEWNEEGFAVGDSITLFYTWYNATPPPFQQQVFNTTVTYVNGNVLHIADPFGLNLPSGFSGHINGRVFPTDNVVSGILAVANKRPESLEFLFNLTPNGSTLLNSLLDGELNRFELKELNLINPLDPPAPMTQLINKSGGLIKDVTLEFLDEDNNPLNQVNYSWKKYRVNYKFLQWGIIKDGFNEPNYYDQADCVAPVARLKSFAQYGNPNGVQTATTENTESNTGGYDENYNGGLSAFTKIDIDWVDLNGVAIDALDYSNKCTFTAIVNAPNQNNPNSLYRMGLVWRPIDGTYYQNKPLTNAGENLLILAPEVDFIADGIADPAIYQGFEDENGARWDFQNLKFEITGVDELTITGDVIPNAQAKALFENVADGGRRSTLWVSIGNFNNDATFLSERVSLKLFDTDNYDAPTIGVQHPYVLNEFLLDHAFNDVTTPEPQTTTEDDVLYTSLFRLEENKIYSGVRLRLWVYNNATDDQFTLENSFIDFDNVPFVNGKYEVDTTINRGFNLPPQSDRNVIRLYRDPSNDIAGFYALKLEYGWLNDWRYWVFNSVVDFAFFDVNEPNNGLNNNWQRFYLPPDWTPVISYYPRYVDGAQEVDDFNNFPFGIRPYEDEDAFTDWTITRLSNNTNPTAFVQNELHIMEALITWNAGSFSPTAWAQMTIENFENGNRWLISSVLPHNGIAQSPLQPIAGVLGLELTFPAPNQANLKALVDANNINVDKVSLTARIGSPSYDWAFDEGGKIALLMCHSYARKLTPFNVYNAPIIRVRRGVDNAEMDIGVTISNDGFWVLDVDALENFATDVDPLNRAWVVYRYDQSDAGYHEYFPTLTQQPLIVKNGVVITDPNTFRVSALYDGINHYGELTQAFPTQTLETLSLSVFNRQPNEASSGYSSATGLTPFTMFWRPTGQINTSLGSQIKIPFVLPLESGAQIYLTWKNQTTYFARLNGVDGISSPDNTLGFGQYNRLDRNVGTIGLHFGYKSEDWVKLENTQNEIELETNVNDFYQIF